MTPAGSCTSLKIQPIVAFPCKSSLIPGFSEVEFPVRSSVTALSHSACLCPDPLWTGTSSSTGTRWRDSVVSDSEPCLSPAHPLRLPLDFHFPNLLPKFQLPHVSSQLLPETGNPRRLVKGGPSGWEAPLQGAYLPPTSVHRAPLRASYEE